MWQILEGDCLERLRELEPESVQTVVTSPPYWGLRDYGTATWEGGDSECDHRKQPTQEKMEALKRNSTLIGAGYDSNHQFKASNFTKVCGKCGAKRIDSQLGLEPTPEEYVENLVAVFREVRRVLRDDGTVWLNLGDSYAGAPVGSFNGGGFKDKSAETGGRDLSGVETSGKMDKLKASGLKPKDLCGIPWRVAFALQADGWWLRSDIIWSKPNPMPESVTDRPTRAHEYVFLLSKSARYFYDADAIREEGKDWSTGGPGTGIEPTFHYGAENGGNEGLAGIAARYKDGTQAAGRNRRSVWEITTQPYPEAHFATFPPKLVEPCILAGSEEGSQVLDPFCGAGTTGLVALRHNRDFIGIELNPDYCELARNRIRDDAPLFNTGTEEGGDGDGAYGAGKKVADKQSQLGEQQKQMKGGDRLSGFNQRWKERNDL